MTYKFTPYLLAIFISSLLVIASCNKDEKTSWDTANIIPLGRTSLSIASLVRDSVLQANPDNSLFLSYRSTVYELNLAEKYFQIPDTFIGQKYTVDSLRLPVSDIGYNVTLGNMARNLQASPDGAQVFFGNYIMSNQGQNKPIGAINNIPTPPFPFDASAYFRTVTLSQGNMQLIIVDSLPIPINNLVFEIRNTSGGLLVSDNISYIPAFGTAYRNYNLVGKTVESSLQFKVVSFGSPGSGGNNVLIDTNNYIKVRGSLQNLRASNAIARFPNQDLVSVDQEVSQNIGERKFSYIETAEGDLEVTITSSVQENMRLTYILKGAFDKYGKPVQILSSIPAATAGQPVRIQRSFSLQDHAINLTGSLGNKFNTYTQVIVARVDSSGIERQITSDDSLRFDFRIRNIKPAYIKGYGGRDTVKFAGNAPFNFINIFNGSQPNALLFEKVNLSLSVENGLGIDGTVKVNSLRGKNANGTTVVLQDNAPTPIIGTNLYVARATDFPLTPAFSSFALNSATSNISNFIGNLPNQIDYDVEIRTNPSGNRGTYDDFAYLSSRLKVNLDLNIPLSIIANNLTLRDSFDFSIGGSSKDIENISNGTLHFITYNKFPIESRVLLVAYDSAWNAVDTLVQNYTLPAADLNSTCRAEVAKRNVVHIAAGNERIDKLRNARHAIVTAIFNTKSSAATCQGAYLKIYSDYQLDAKITADFNYKVKF